MTSQFLATAYLQILEPRKPLPPQTTSLLAAVMVGLGVCVEAIEDEMELIDSKWFQKRLYVMIHF